MAEAVVRCPHCQRDAVVKYGKASNGKERVRCQQNDRCGRTFLLTYAYPGCLPSVKRQMVEMTLSGSGSRDIARVLQVGPNTGLKELKKSLPPIPGEQKRSGRVLSRRDSGRRAARGSRRGRGNVEFRAEQNPAPLVVACHGSFDRGGARVCVRQSGR